MTMQDETMQSQVMNPQTHGFSVAIQKLFFANHEEFSSYWL